MMSSLNFWYCAGVAVLLLAGTYIFWGPSNRPKRKKKDAIPGLVNLGNSCFINAVLQALAACAHYLSWLRDIVESTPDATAQNLVLVRALLAVLEGLNHREETCSAAEVIEALRCHRWIITHEEQDAHELFHVLTTTLEEEIEAGHPVLSLLDAKKLEESGAEGVERPAKSFVSSHSPPSSKIPSPLAGLLASELQCHSCNSKYPTKCDSFDSISLGIPVPHFGQVTLQDLLLKFISRELLQDATCDLCSRPEESSVRMPESGAVFSKQLSFGKLPRCLCIHIQRTAWMKNGLSVKCYDYVAFPEVLIMDHFVHCHTKKNKHLGASHTRMSLTGGSAEKNGPPRRAPPADGIVKMAAESEAGTNKGGSARSDGEEYLSAYNYVYLLKAVIVHVGDATTGHFLTYKRGPEVGRRPARWFCASDAEVGEVPLADVFRSCAYMLFYEKI